VTPAIAPSDGRYACIAEHVFRLKTFLLIGRRANQSRTFSRFPPVSVSVITSRETKVARVTGKDRGEY